MYIKLRMIDLGEDRKYISEEYVHEEIMYISELILPKLQEFVKALNEELDKCEDTNIAWEIQPIEAPPSGIFKVVEQIHVLGTDCVVVDRIYRDMIRKHIDPAYNKTFLSEG